MNLIKRLESYIEKALAKLKLGMRAKLIIIFVIIKVIPLILLTITAWGQARLLGEVLNLQTGKLTGEANAALTETGRIAVEDSIAALNNRTTEELERTSTDMARRVADFLYDRDRDILFLGKLAPSESLYRNFIQTKTRPLVKQREWILSEDRQYWVPREPLKFGAYSPSSNPENDTNYHNRPGEVWETEDRPLYLELTYVDLEGNELIKVTSSPRMDSRRRNVADRRNTYVKAESYFPELAKLRPGEIYVSDVIGAYVGSRLIGMYNPENAAALGLPWQPEEEAYAGRENPLGRRFQGIIRWASPVTHNGRADGRVTGYVTLALDHDHIMEFTDHTTPMDERYVEMPSAYEGNYAFIWDYQCRSISHPRHHSIVGYNPETGEPEVPWLEESIYRDWQASGLPYAEFIRDVPIFADQSRDKKPAPELTAAGLVGLDGRYLNNAPQCTGWFDLTAEGGSGSFLILWSGIWKPNTAATIPYYTGQYGKTKRGFGFVAIGAGLEDFQRPALETKEVLDELITRANDSLSQSAFETRKAISDNRLGTTIRLNVFAGCMIIVVVLIAIWMASVFTSSITSLISGISRFRAGERHFRFNAPVKDELGILADSFDEMADSLVAADQSPVVILNMDLKIIYINELGLEALGRSWEETRGKTYYECSFYPAGTEYDPITALQQGKETEVLYAPNRGRYFKGNAAYLSDKQGRNIGYVITSTDVTEIILQQKKTAGQKALLDTIFTASPDLIWYRDTEDRILAANPRYASLSGKRPEDMAGVKEKYILPPGALPIYEKIKRRAIESRKPSYFEQAVVFADGHREILDTIVSPIFDESGSFMGILGFARDVSARVTIEEELRHTQENLEKAVQDANRANEHKGAFLARMSHEIRTPMNAIIGMTGIVKRKISSPGADPAEILINIGQIETSSQHLLGLLNDILDISKIEAGKIEITSEAADLLNLVNTVKTIIQPRCDEKNIRFNSYTNLDAGYFYETDTLRLRQVLINLLGNAVKFTPREGRIDFEAVLKERKDGKALVGFLVRDTGIGIEESAMDSLFKPFEQANHQISKKFGGTGLGLAISRNIVRLLGGDISVKSKVEEGTEFGFSLWFSETSVKKDRELAAADPTGIFKGKRALLVDDVEINRIIAASMLEVTGLEIDEADDGYLGLKKFEESPENGYDIIYMDVQMPKMNGYEATKAIRALDRPDAKTVPIVALTANAFKDDIEKALESGMNAHLAKPMEMEKVMELSYRLIRGKEKNPDPPLPSFR
ncbi:MAG: PAS domain-containing protein [Treponema sp.]|jgi:PAS domain S-box-containing protein|nr:PAS domain-containing protein [Treponema sp.]